MLRERGLAKPQQQEPSTFRAKLFGSDRLNERHLAAQYRGVFAEKVEVE